MSRTYTFAEFCALPRPIQDSVIAAEDAAFHEAVERAKAPPTYGLEVQPPNYSGWFENNLPVPVLADQSGLEQSYGPSEARESMKTDASVSDSSVGQNFNEGPTQEECEPPANNDPEVD